MGSDFEKQRLEQEAARRAAAGQRDAARREALQAGARAPSRADAATPASASRVVMVGAGALAVLCVPVGLVAWATPLAALAFGAAVVFGAVAFGARSYAGKREASSAWADMRLAELAGALSGTPTWEQALQRARAAVQTAGLEPSRARGTAEALDAGAAEIRELNRLRLSAGGKDLAARTDARISAFVANCEAIVSALAPAAGAPPASALDSIAEQFSAESEARAELDGALRAASTLRQPGG